MRFCIEAADAVSGDLARPVGEDVKPVVARRRRADLVGTAVLLVIGIALLLVLWRPDFSQPDALHEGLSYDDVVAVPQEVDNPTCNGMVEHVIDVGGHVWSSTDGSLVETREYQGVLLVEAPLANGYWYATLSTGNEEVEFSNRPTEIACEVSGA